MPGLDSGLSVGTAALAGLPASLMLEGLDKRRLIYMSRYFG